MRALIAIGSPNIRPFHSSDKGVSLPSILFFLFMPRILSIDYGRKRTGLAWTDPMQIIATALETVETAHLKSYLADLLNREDIETLVLGYPTRLDGSDTHVTGEIREFAEFWKNSHPNIPLHLWDERFTSQMAKQSLIDSGVKKKRRRDKSLIDQVSATIILQEYMNSIL